MKKLLLLFLLFGLFSCSDSDSDRVEIIRHVDTEIIDIVTDASGKQYPFLDPAGVPYCGPGFGRKMCFFLNKYHETIWVDTENYTSEFSAIKFSNFPTNSYFLSFFKLDSITSYCDGWKVGDTTSDGIKWHIDIKRDEVDLLWFDYEYYGTSEEIEYTIAHRYEVIDGLLHFSSSDGQSFIFHPSEISYSKDSIDTGEIIELDGCLFF